MKKTIITNGLICGLFFLCTAKLSAQQSTHEVEKFATDPVPAKYTGAHNEHEATGAKEAATTGCKYRIDYAGDNSAYVAGFGGLPQSSAVSKRKGFIMVFPAQGGNGFRGHIVGAEFEARTGNGWGPTANVSVQVFDLNASFQPVGSPLASVVGQVAGTTLDTYTVTFPSPVEISGNNGFAIGLVANSTSDSLFAGFNMKTMGDPVLGYVVVHASPTPVISTSYWSPANTNLYTTIRPIVTPSFSPTYSTAQTSTSCALPITYGFTMAAMGMPGYSVNAIAGFSSQPIQLTGESISYGDGSPVQNTTTPAYHAYATAGTFPVTFSVTYSSPGFLSGNCVSTHTLNVNIVTPPLPSFQYTANGLTVTLFNNSSGSLSNFTWNFGDLTTSNLMQPGSHTFGASGTYVIELEATASCGKVRYSVSVTVSSGTSGLGNEPALTGELVSLRPNPASNALQIVNAGKDRLDPEVEIYNLAGSLVKSVKAERLGSGDAVIDIAELPGGLYFMKLQTERGHIVKSFVKE